jgi:uncharacterized protein with von Willebrand factor type A (vWA) domain
LPQPGDCRQRRRNPRRFSNADMLPRIHLVYLTPEPPKIRPASEQAAGREWQTLLCPF